jgi:translation initiation factor IF-1
MVKNTTGGKAAKSMASKNSGSSSNTKLTVSSNRDEVYAIASKMLGNSTFNCIGLDGNTYLCHIRGKFSGKGKRDNTVSPGTWVLVGLYQWNASSADLLKRGKVKLRECDLLEVYSDRDKQRLRDSVSEDWEILDKNDPRNLDGFKKEEQSAVSFQSEKEADVDRLTAEVNSMTTQKISLADKSSDSMLTLDDVFDI